MVRAVAVVCAMAAAAQAPADVLELKDGRVLTGKYAGGTAGTVRIETAGGLQAVESSQALALTFTGEAAPAEVVAPAKEAPAAAVTKEATPAPAAPSGSVVVPAGTVLLVRMVDGASSQSPQGKRFATVLDTDLIVDGVMVAKAGSKVYGRIEKAVQAGRVAGKSELDIRLTELTVGGVLVPVTTGPYAAKGANSLGKTVKGAVAGAAIGAFSGHAGEGAGIGAAASVAKKGQPVGVPPGALLEFELKQPVTISNAR
jgi:hypothetical protein